MIRRAEGRVAYLSQRLDLLDTGRTVAENLAAFAPAMPEAQRMNLLARFLFRGSRIHLPVGVLSGGERLRATLACVLFAEPAPQLLLLDEPTNNLDLVSVGQLETALNAYRRRVRGGQPRRAVPGRDQGGTLAGAATKAGFASQGPPCDRYRPRRRDRVAPPAGALL